MKLGHYQILRNGKVTIDKVKIREVSSHFTKGWWYLTISPQNNSN